MCASFWIHPTRGGEPIEEILLLSIMTPAKTVNHDVLFRICLCRSRLNASSSSVLPLYTLTKFLKTSSAERSSSTTPASKNPVPHSLSISTSSSSTSAQLLSLPFFPSCGGNPQPSLPLLPRLLLSLVNFFNPRPYTRRTPSPHILVPLSKHRKVASLVHGDGVSAELPVLLCLAFGGGGMAAERVLDFVAVAHCDGIGSE
jgi:hypothetical protein